MSVYNEDVLLIHCPKAAGTSCRSWMLRHLPGAVINSLEDGPLPIDSTPLRHVTEYTGRPLDSWDLIVIPIRNPYHQVVSHWTYHFDRYARGGRHVHDRTAAMKPTLGDWLREPHSDFRVWYEHQVRRKHKDIGAVLEYVDKFGFYEYYITVDGEIPDNVELVDVSDLSERWPELMAPYADELPPLPHKRSSPHNGDYFSYHDGWTIAAVEDRFRWIFEQGHYDKVEVAE